MTNIINFAEVKGNKYKTDFPIGEVIEYKHFKRIIIDDDMDWFMKLRTNENFGRKSKKSAMKTGMVQHLLTWVSTEDRNSMNYEHIGIFMGLKPDPYAISIESMKYSLYFQVGSNAYNISPQLDTFDEAFAIFKDSVNEFIYGISNKK